MPMHKSKQDAYIIVCYHKIKQRPRKPYEFTLKRTLFFVSAHKMNKKSKVAIQLPTR